MYLAVWQKNQKSTLSQYANLAICHFTTDLSITHRILTSLTGSNPIGGVKVVGWNHKIKRLICNTAYKVITTVSGKMT